MQKKRSIAKASSAQGGACIPYHTIPYHVFYLNSYCAPNMMKVLISLEIKGGKWVKTIGNIILPMNILQIIHKSTISRVDKAVPVAFAH